MYLCCSFLQFICHFSSLPSTDSKYNSTLALQFLLFCLKVSNFRVSLPLLFLSDLLFHVFNFHLHLLLHFLHHQFNFLFILFFLLFLITSPPFNCPNFVSANNTQSHPSPGPALKLHLSPPVPCSPPASYSSYLYYILKQP